MAEMTIRLIRDPDTGKKNIIISLTSDADSLPNEHEQAHRALADKLIEGGLVKAGELGKISVVREEEAPVGALPSGEQPQKAAAKQGN
jgi:hypothetical protein